MLARDWTFTFSHNGTSAINIETSENKNDAALYNSTDEIPKNENGPHTYASMKSRIWYKPKYTLKKAKPPHEDITSILINRFITFVIFGLMISMATPSTSL